MKTRNFIFLFLSIGMLIEAKAQITPTDTLWGGDSPELGWGVIGGPIIKDDLGKRDLVILPEARQRENELCFVSPIDMALPYYIYEGNEVKALGTLTLEAREEECINIGYLSAGTYLFVLKIGNSCYGCRFEVE